jgi:ankyrin repeat protein
VINGRVDIASYLLQNGAEWDLADSSGNTPLIYACAYGFIECIDLLIKAGADANLQNSWKLSSANVAMLKNHFGCVKRILEQPNVDVNVKDDKGRTLLALCLYSINEKSAEFVRYLLLDKKADPNIADENGVTPLILLGKA